MFSQIRLPIPDGKMFQKVQNVFSKESVRINILVTVLLIISGICFLNYYHNGLGLAYNDARSHLDIGRRVVEGLKPGLAQIGSVWLPLPHVLMIPTIWNDFMWHSGLSGAIQSMLSFTATGILIYLFLRKLDVGILGRIVGIILFIGNINILYLQSTPMTELLLIASMTASAYYFMVYLKEDKIIDLLKTAFWTMLASLNRYDGWFLFVFIAGILGLVTLWKRGFRVAEGKVILFSTLAGLGIVGWLVWNLLIFKDPLYFAFGPFSAHAQQLQLESAGDLLTKHNIVLSTQIYLYAVLYNSYTIPLVIAVIGSIVFLLDKKISILVKIASATLTAPFIFNIIALFLGHSVLFIQNFSGETWFNVRYGVVIAPFIAIFIGYLIDRIKPLRPVFFGMLAFVLVVAFINKDAVTIDDARVGSSQKNVSEVSGWLKKNTINKEGFVLISAASHDAIIFSSGLPMSRFIHEGTGAYWESATVAPDRWARWIIMRTYDENDLTYKAVEQTDALEKYNKVGSYPFADIYEIKPEYLPTLNTKPIFKNQK